ncbi:MAG: CocE/NonD family hydrolase [bacterium]
MQTLSVKSNLCLLTLLLVVTISCERETEFSFEYNYSKKEYRIPMRDGKTLFTSVYLPEDKSEKHPIILWRTPYSVAPYGENKYQFKLLLWKHFFKENYIVVMQDVRGRFMSEGEFDNMRPLIIDRKDSSDVDESTDCYDTIDWLVKNIPNNNGKVGLWGISYPGFYAAMGAINAHPALKAVSPQAPIADWFTGDDMHHNGAFALSPSFSFFYFFGPRRNGLTTEWPQNPDWEISDAYNFFLQNGTFKNINEKYFHNEIDFWNQCAIHGTYDEYWQSRSSLPHFNNISPAVMTVGGWFDAENLYGALQTYKSIEQKNPKINNIVIIGPWTHGAWSRENISSYGPLKFVRNTSDFYRDSIELPFFNHFLKDEDEFNFPEAYVFITGKNIWQKFKYWPPKTISQMKLYLNAEGELSLNRETNGAIVYHEFISDPSHPVPYTAQFHSVAVGYNKEFMAEDQRFASSRPDVLTFETEPLSLELTVAGKLTVELFASTTGTDADWVVKLIDEFPAEAEWDDSKTNCLQGFQMLVRGEIMRGKFRNSLEKPEPFKPGEVTKVVLNLNDVCHTFFKGHRIQIQVQSSWFPLFDRNPQQFMDIYSADDKDFIKATHRVFHSTKYPSNITLGIWEAK